MSERFCIATNACAGDHLRILRTVPSWLRTFGQRVDEVVIVVDEAPSSGRIADLHGGGQALAPLYESVRTLSREDSRIRHVVLQQAKSLAGTSDKWFGGVRPVRCQAGTPIFAFVQGIEEARNDFVLRADCDMLFHEVGWLSAAAALLTGDEMDIVEPPRLGGNSTGTSCAVSSRAFLLLRERFAKRCLPMQCQKLDLLRIFHRRLLGRPPWLALEQTLEFEKRHGRMRHCILDTSLGYSLHIPRRSDVLPDWFEQVVWAVEAGRIPSDQKINPDYLPAVWRDWISNWELLSIRRGNT